MQYLVAVLSDRLQAETAYAALDAQDFPLNTVAILGKGFQSADEFGFVDPNQKVRQQALRMMTWTIPFGFAAGVTFSIISQLETFIWAGVWGNHIIGGILGAIGGAMGGLFVGGGTELIPLGWDALPYQRRLDAGQFLLVIQGSETLTRRATRILRPLNPASLKDYLLEPTGP